MGLSRGEMKHSGAMVRSSDDGAVYGWEELRASWGESLTFPDVQLDLIRHGETELNRQGLVSGSVDVDLSLIGRRQALEFGPLLRPPYQGIFVSALHRTRATVELAFHSRGMRPHYAIDSRLNERSLGVLEMQPRVFIKQFAAGDLDYAPPGGESYRVIVQRCLSFLLDLQRLARDWPALSRVLICTHMGPMRILIGTLLHESSAARMLGHMWSNALAVRLELSSVPWPPYLREGRND